MVGLGRSHVVLGVVGVVVAWLNWMPEGEAASFHLTTGEVVEGEVIQATRNTIILRSTAGRVLPTSVGQIKQVVLSLVDGSELTGEFVSWTDEVFEIRSADLLMHVKNGEIADDNTEVAAPAIEMKPAPQPDSIESKPSVVVNMQSLPEFTLSSGQVLVGQIIHATGSIVTVRLYGRGIFPTSIAQVDRVRFVGEDGRIFDGSFEDWSDDVYRLKDGDQDVLASLSDRAAEAGPSPALQAQAAAIEPAEDPDPEIMPTESADAAASPATGAESSSMNGSDAPPELENSESAPNTETNAEDVVEIDDMPGAGGPVSELAATGLADPSTSLGASTQQIAILDEGGAPHLVEPIVKDVSEDGEVVAFEFHLSPPASRPLTILYAATDDTAIAGQDFVAKSGVITFGAGSSYAEIDVPLINDEQGETSEQFYLFLSGDPEVVKFSQRQVPATINDND